MADVEDYKNSEFAENEQTENANTVASASEPALVASPARSPRSKSPRPIATASALSKTAKSSSSANTQRTQRQPKADTMLAQLQMYNEELQARLNAFESQYNELVESQSLSAQSASSSLRQIDELTLQLQTSQSQYSTLKQQHTNSLAQLAKLESQSVDLLSSQVQETNQRIDLESRLIKCEIALRKERDENGKLKAMLNSNGLSQRMDETLFNSERDSYRLTITELNNRIDHLNEQVKSLTLTEKELLLNINALNREMYAKDLLSGNLNQELIKAMKSATQASEENRESQSRISSLEDQVGVKGQHILELESIIKAQKETLRQQTDKISSVVFQLNRVDEWKIGAESERAEREAQMMELRGICDSQIKTMNTALLARERSDSMISILEDRIGKESKRSDELKMKIVDVEREYKSAMNQVRQAQGDYDALTIKYSHLQSKYNQLHHMFETEQQMVHSLQNKYQMLVNDNEHLRTELAKVEDDKFVLGHQLADKEAEMQALKKKDDIYNKIQSMLLTSPGGIEVNAMLASLMSYNDKYVHYTNPVIKGKMKIALQTAPGQRVKDLMRKHEFENRDLLDWAIEPQRLIDGMDALAKKLLQTKHTQRANGQGSDSGSRGSIISSSAATGANNASSEDVAMLEQQVELLTAKQSQLAQSLVKCENDKSKAIRRHVDMMAVKSRAVAKVMTEAADADADSNEARMTFLTELEAQHKHDNPDSSEPLDTTDSDAVYQYLGISKLLLSDAGIEDNHCSDLLSLLHDNQSVTEIDLRHNSITNTGLKALIECVLNPRNTVKSLDLQQNAITLDGLEMMAFDIVKYARHGPIIGAGSGSEKKSGNSYVLNASFHRDGTQLLPILTLRLPHKSLIVDLRYNRLQHSETGGINSVRGESVKQCMKRILTRVMRAFSEINRTHSDESVGDFENANSWMTEAEVAATIAKNSERKAKDDARRESLMTTFDTQLTPTNNRKISELNSISAPSGGAAILPAKSPKSSSTASSKKASTRSGANAPLEPILPMVRTPTSGRSRSSSKSSTSKPSPNGKGCEEEKTQVGDDDSNDYGNDFNEDASITLDQ